MDNPSCFLYGPGDMRVENQSLPVIEDDHDVLVRIAFVGVCGSDVHFWKHGGVTRKVSEEAPLVMGHEAAGVVSAIGPSVTGVKLGDKVAIEPGISCRRCKRCKTGKYNLCSQMRFAADPPHNHGTLCRLYKTSEDFVYKIPNNINLEEAVLVEPLSVAVHGARLANLKSGQSVLVQGSGTIGLLCAAVAKAMGAKSVAIADINEKKLQFAKRFTECTTIQAQMGSVPADEAGRFIAEAGVDEGFDVVLECSGVESSAQTGLYASIAGGTFVQIGMGKHDQTLPLGSMCEKETTVKTAFRYGPTDYELAIHMLASGQVSVKSMITSITPFEKASEAWEKTQRGEGIKNLIRATLD